MSIFTKPLSKLDTSDLQELLTEQAVENARLEFKSDVPDRDETLKIALLLREHIRRVHGHRSQG